MQQAMLEVNGVQTHVITEGRWVEEGLAQSGHKDIVLVIPGNPGIPSYYEFFIKSLKRRLPTEISVWTVGYAGHVLPPKNLCFALPDDASHWHRYSLNGQVEHKMAFINQYIPKDAKIHLVGHSIGCWIILQLLKNKEFADRVVKCYMLFPTIEHMSESKNGKFFTNVAMKTAPILIFISWIFSLLPMIVQNIILRLFGGFFGITNKSVKPTLQLLNPTVVKRVFHLAQEELLTVRELEHDIISKYKDKLWLYYGSDDHWVPSNCCNDLKTKYPRLNAQVCKRSFPHAFVLSHDEPVGNMMGDIINETIL